MTPETLLVGVILVIAAAVWRTSRSRRLLVGSVPSSMFRYYNASTRLPSPSPVRSPVSVYVPASFFCPLITHLASAQIFVDSQRLALARAAPSFATITYYLFLDAPCVFLCLVLWLTIRVDRSVFGSSAAFAFFLSVFFLV